MSTDRQTDPKVIKGVLFLFSLTCPGFLGFPQMSQAFLSVDNLQIQFDLD